MKSYRVRIRWHDGQVVAFRVYGANWWQASFRCGCLLRWFAHAPGVEVKVWRGRMVIFPVVF